MIIVREYTQESGRSPYADWFNRLNSQAAAKVSTALLRIEYGNLSNVKSVGGGVYEYRINFGPGYRLYFGKEGEKLIILLLGGDKKRQAKDIQKAHDYWQDYKKRKKSKRIKPD